MNLIIIGAQGSGKGTQASLLVERLGLRHVSSGDIFRAAIQNGTELGMQAKSYIDRGDLVPDSLTIHLILALLSEPEYSSGVALDGFPRTRDQAQALDLALPQMQKTIDYAIYLNVPQEKLLDRLLNRYVCEAHQHVYNIRSKPPITAGICDIDGSKLIQRSDDNPENIKHRLNIFFQQTIQVTHFYRAQKKLIEVDGDQPIAKVSADIFEAMGLQSEFVA